MPAPRIAAHMIEKVSWETPFGSSVATTAPSRLMIATASAFVTARSACTISCRTVTRLPPALERILPERQVAGHVFGQDHPLAKEQSVAGVRHHALVQFPDRVELLLRDLHGAGHWVARTWERTIKVPRWLFSAIRPRGQSAAAALRTREQVPVPHQVRRVHAAGFAVTLDPLRELRLETGPVKFPGDFN